MLFKLYIDNNPLFFYSVSSLADFCEVTRKEAERAYFRKVAKVGEYEVINYSH